MEFTIETESLTKLLASPKKIIGEKDAVAFTVFSADKEGSFNIESGGEGVYFKALTLAEVEEAGDFTVKLEDFKKLYFSGKKITFFLEDKELAFKSGRFKGKIPVTQSDKANKPLKPIKKLLKIDREDLMNGLSYLKVDDSVETVEMMLKVRVAKNKLEMVSNGIYIAGRYRTKTSAEGKLSFVVKKPLFVQVMEATKDHKYIKIGSDGKMVRIKTDTIDCYIPVMQRETTNISEFLQKKKKEKIKYIAKCNFIAEEAVNALKSTSSVALISEGKDISVSCSVPKVSSERVKIRAANSKDDFAVTELKAKDGATWELSSKLIISTLDLLGTSNIKLSVADSYMILKGLDVNVIYISAMMMPPEEEEDEVEVDDKKKKKGKKGKKK